MDLRFEAIPADTTPEAARVQREIYRRMTPDQKVQQIQEMNETLGQCLAAGVRMRHPTYDDGQIKMAVIRLRLGAELFRQVYPGVEIEA